MMNTQSYNLQHLFAHHPRGGHQHPMARPPFASTPPPAAAATPPSLAPSKQQPPSIFRFDAPRDTVQDSPFFGGVDPNQFDTAYMGHYGRSYDPVVQRGDIKANTITQDVGQSQADQWADTQRFRLFGGLGDDTLTQNGDFSRSLLFGGGGADTLAQTGNNGLMAARGGQGNDQIEQAGNQSIFKANGGRGNDFIRQVANNGRDMAMDDLSGFHNVALGGLGDDNLFQFGNNSDFTAIGGQGDDAFRVGGGKDSTYSVFGGSGFDTAMLSGLAKDWQFDATSSTFRHDGRDVTVNTHNIEQVLDSFGRIVPQQATPATGTEQRFF